MYNEWVLASETKYSVKAKKEVTFKITLSLRILYCCGIEKTFGNQGVFLYETFGQKPSPNESI